MFSHVNTSPKCYNNTGLDIMKQEVRRNDDETIDEIAGEGHYHLEQMSNNEWCLHLDETLTYLSADAAIAATTIEEEE